MSDTDELSSPLPPRAPAHAAMDLHSKLGHLNTGETIFLLALWNCPQKVCIHCLFTSLVLPLPSLPLHMPTLFSFLLWNRYTTCRYQADSVIATALRLGGFGSALWVSSSHAKIFVLFANTRVSNHFHLNFRAKLSKVELSMRGNQCFHGTKITWPTKYFEARELKSTKWIKTGVRDNFMGEWTADIWVFKRVKVSMEYATSSHTVAKMSKAFHKLCTGV